MVVGERNTIYDSSKVRGRMMIEQRKTLYDSSKVRGKILKVY